MENHKKTESVVPVKKNMNINEENKDNFFIKWAKGNERRTVIGMFSLMVVFTIIILIDRQVYKDENQKFDIEQIQFPNVINEINETLDKYKNTNNAQDLYKEYEFLITRDSLDTLKIKQIEKELNKILLNN